MNRIKNNESGFSAVEIVILIVIVGLIGAVGYLVYKNHNQSTKVVTATNKTNNTPKTTISTNNTSSSNPSSGWKSYCSKIGYICYKYPANWKFTSNTYANDPIYPEDDEINSPSGNVRVVYSVVSIKGVVCECTVNVVGAHPVGKYFQHVELAYALNQKTYDSDYSVEDSLINISDTEGSTKNPYMAGDQFDNSTGSNVWSFVNPGLPNGTHYRSYFTVGGRVPNLKSLAEAENWYKSNEVMTANQILDSVTIYTP